MQDWWWPIAVRALTGNNSTDELVTWSLAPVGVWGLLADGQTFLIDTWGYAEANSRRKT
jgi:hypothetical protein